MAVRLLPSRHAGLASRRGDVARPPVLPLGLAAPTSLIDRSSTGIRIKKNATTCFAAPELPGELHASFGQLVDAATQIDHPVMSYILRQPVLSLGVATLFVIVAPRVIEPATKRLGVPIAAGLLAWLVVMHPSATVQAIYDVEAIIADQPVAASVVILALGALLTAPYLALGAGTTGVAWLLSSLVLQQGWVPEHWSPAYVPVRTIQSKWETASQEAQERGVTPPPTIPISPPDLSAVTSLTPPNIKLPDLPPVPELPKVPELPRLSAPSLPSFDSLDFSGSLPSFDSLGFPGLKIPSMQESLDLSGVRLPDLPGIKAPSAPPALAGARLKAISLTPEDGIASASQAAAESSSGAGTTAAASPGEASDTQETAPFLAPAAEALEQRSFVPDVEVAYAPPESSIEVPSADADSAPETPAEADRSSKSSLSPTMLGELAYAEEPATGPSSD